jgi:hypothetical protein
MRSLGFEILDRHVVAGRGDDLACAIDDGALSFAQMLERSAALAGALKALGVEPGHDVAVRVDGVDRVVAVCACVRLGAHAGADGAVAVEPDGELSFAVLVKAGAGDPASSLPSDAPGYADAMRAAHPDVVGPLLEGRPVT